jgi:hypothetical protein
MCRRSSALLGSAVHTVYGMDAVGGQRTSHQQGSVREVHHMDVSRVATHLSYCCVAVACSSTLLDRTLNSSYQSQHSSQQSHRCSC